MKAIILRNIPVGRENAINCKELARITGSEPRAIKSFISKCRLSGIVICSSLDVERGGYFYPKNLDELKDYVTVEQQRINTAQEALNPAIKKLSEEKRA